jgi:DNA-binding LacI/PurR family transcriptional regulator
MTSLPSVGTINNMGKFPVNRGSRATEVLRELDQLCSSLRVGQQFPSRRELMQRLGASDHAVNRALDELSRQGKIIKRLGRGGSIVADSSQPAMPSDSQAESNGNAIASGTLFDSRTIVAIGKPDGGIFDNAMQLLMEQAKSAKLSLTYQMMHHDEAAHFVAPPVAQGPRGYILFRRQFLPLAQRLQAEGHRVVFVGASHSDNAIEVPIVSGDQEHGGYLAIKHLLELGHRRIAFHFAGDYLTLRRWIGCQRALTEAREKGLELHTEMIEATYGGELGGPVTEWGGDLDLARAYFARPEAPTALVSWNDDMAVTMLTLLQRAGLRVPEDISLIGYDNLTRSAAVHPPLTTIDGALDQQIQAALRLLTQTDPPSKTRSIIVLPTLIRRESTAAPSC